MHIFIIRKIDTLETECLSTQYETAAKSATTTHTHTHTQTNKQTKRGKVSEASAIGETKVCVECACAPYCAQQTARKRGEIKNRSFITYLDMRFVQGDFFFIIEDYCVFHKGDFHKRILISNSSFIYGESVNRENCFSPQSATLQSRLKPKDA